MSSQKSHAYYMHNKQLFFLLTSSPILWEGQQKNSACCRVVGSFRVRKILYCLCLVSQRLTGTWLNSSFWPRSPPLESDELWPTNKARLEHQPLGVRKQWPPPTRSSSKNSSLFPASEEGFQLSHLHWISDCVFGVNLTRLWLSTTCQLCNLWGPL